MKPALALIAALLFSALSAFKRTMKAEQANGAQGCMPTAKAFEGGSYETWFGDQLFDHPNHTRPPCICPTKGVTWKSHVLRRP